jgi:hypothetical protein
VKKKKPSIHQSECRGERSEQKKSYEVPLCIVAYRVYCTEGRKKKKEINTLRKKFLRKKICFFGKDELSLQRLKFYGL